MKHVSVLRTVFFLLALSGMSAGLFTACKETALDVPNTSVEPVTYLIADTIGNVQSTTVRLRWWGDVPNGTVGGYFVSFDRVNWAFTAGQDSTFRLRQFTSDTAFRFFVSAVRRDGGGTVYEPQIVRGGITFGSEPYTDLNSNGRYDEGEPFVNIGAVSTTPATFSFRTRNQPPGIQLSNQIPDTAFPVIQFDFNVSDPDGLQGISRIDISLNDSTYSAPVSIPVNAELMQITLESISPRSAASAVNVFTGTSATPLPTQLNGLRMGQRNTLYARVVDIAAARSRDTAIVWATFRTRSSLVVVDDFGETGIDPLQSADPEEGVLLPVFRQVRNGRYSGDSLYQTVTIKAPTPSTTQLNRRIAQHVRPAVLQRILGDYTVILWYTNAPPSVELAQPVLQPLLEQGVNVLMLTGLAAGSPSATSLQFSTAQRITPFIATGASANSSLTNNMPLAALPVQKSNGDTIRYPALRLNGLVFPSAYRVGGQLLQADVEPIYRLPNQFVVPSDTNAGFLCARKIYRRSGQRLGTLVFSTAPFYKNVCLTNDPFTTDTTALRNFYETVFRDEFNQ
jgi:hypothetical protein